MSSLIALVTFTSMAVESQAANRFNPMSTLLAGAPPQATGFVAKYWNARKADVERQLGKDPKAEKSGQYGYAVHFTSYKGARITKSMPRATSVSFTYWWKDPRVSFVDIYFKAGSPIGAILKEAGLSAAKLSSPYHDGGKPGDDSAHETWLKENYSDDPLAFQKWQPGWTAYRTYDVMGHGLKNATVIIRVREALDKQAKIVDKELFLSVQTTRKS